ncbi:peptidylprolyl isomerase [Paenibacillus sp. JCM 10914]|uniref:peptidylprolyl isomerase n=1 Tax=Paenibacillus sp. JCM 10914 TaxID=1236974 RepID=UPI0003CC6A8A|nr:peptidylprolyl isomerase [Paenibacillus sp. JCM 10914]GAE09949.1 foldase protein PrsA precursor [Paenibacillus sp. JCM 10914]
MPSRSNKAWKTFIVSITAVLSMSMIAACGNDNENNPEEDTSKVVVKYQGGEITEKEFDLEQRMIQFLSPEYAQFLQMDEFKEYLAKQGVAYEYLYAKADDKAKEAAEKQADELIKGQKNGMGEEQYNAALEAQNLTEADLKNYMLRVITVMEHEKNQITEEDIKKDFEANKQDYTSITVRHVLVGFTDPEGKERAEGEALKLAKEVQSKLNNGEDFAAIAKEYSEDPGSKDSGGLYENQPAGRWVPQFKEKALTLELDKISDPVETDYGYHVMKVEKREEMTYDKLPADQKDGILNELASANVDHFMQNELNDIIESMDLPKSEAPPADNPAEGEEAPPADNPAETPAEGDNAPETGTEGDGK